MKVSVVIASCKRPAMFAAMLQSLKDTTQGYDIETIAVVDDDPETAKIAVEQCDILNYSATRRGAIFAWNLGLSLSSGEIIVPAGDDQKFYPNWLREALLAHEGRLHNYGVVGMNDLAYDGNTQLATMYMMDRKFIKEVLGGVLAMPCYHYYCVDSEINAKAKPNNFCWCKEAIVEHLHSAHGKRSVDEHDLERGRMNYMEMDNAIFEDRKRRGFPIEWESVI